MAERMRLLSALAATLLVIVACSSSLGPSAVVPTPLVLLTHDAFAISDAVMAKFEAQHNVDVQILKGGDAGEMVNKAILTRDVPLADVLYGVDNTFLSRAHEAGIFEAYASPALPAVPETLRSNTEGAVTPIDYGDVCLNYDKSAFVAPTRLEDLVDPSYNRTLVVENPATSSPGLAFLLATIGRYGESGESTWKDYWTALRQNDVLVVDDWDTAYYTSFTAGSGGTGDRPIVVSYATSPVAEVVFADPPVTEAPTGVVTDGCFRQVEYAGVLKGTKEPELARAFIDFMLSPDFQSDIPLNMYVFPASNAATIPEVFSDNAAEVTDAITIEPAEIAANRERWVQEWTDVVLR